MPIIDNYFHKLIELGGSDLHITQGQPPKVRVHGSIVPIAGEPVLSESDALAMFIDVFSERGYHAVVDVHRIVVPESVDLATGNINCRVKKVYRTIIRFKGSEIRRG